MSHEGDTWAKSGPPEGTEDTGLSIPMDTRSAQHPGQHHASSDGFPSAEPLTPLRSGGAEPPPAGTQGMSDPTSTLLSHRLPKPNLSLPRLH